jgi:hypothetical protein
MPSRTAAAFYLEDPPADLAVEPPLDGTQVADPQRRPHGHRREHGERDAQR